MLPNDTSPVGVTDEHVSTLMPAFDYDRLAPAALLAASPQHLLPGSISYLNVQYAAPLGWRPLLLDVHVPAHGKGPHPTVLYVHGGSFLGGIKAMGPWVSLPAAGIAVVSVSYRLSGEAQFPEPIEDIRAAVRWTRFNAEKFNLQPDSLALWGSSAGAYLASMVAVTGDSALGRPTGAPVASSARVACVVNHYGISDFSALLEDAFENDESEKDALARIVRQFLGFDPSAERERTARTSPALLAAGQVSTPPFLFMHGDEDHRVGFGQSVRFHRNLLGLGRSSTLITFPGADHGDNVFAEAEAVGQAITFLRTCWANDGSND
jgi:acetyl esterase/lipase